MSTVLAEVTTKSTKHNNETIMFTQVFEKSVSTTTGKDNDMEIEKPVVKNSKDFLEGNIKDQESKFLECSNEDSENIVNLKALNISSGKLNLSQVEKGQKPQSCEKDGRRRRIRRERKREKKETNEEGTGKTKEAKVKDDQYPKLVPIETAKKLLEEQDPENMEYIQGYIRINARFVTHSYIPIPGEEMDLLIVDVRSRNKALEGDLVVVALDPEKDWQTLPNGQKQKTGKVICILEELHSRKATGFLQINSKHPVLHPKDKRIPFIRLEKTDKIVQEYIEKPELHKDTLFLAEIVTWDKSVKPSGRILEVVGKAGDIEAESRAILLEHSIDFVPYSNELIEQLPRPGYELTELDLKDREDWRQECVFTIDPSTAVDLDDAVSCKQLENGNYEIGVHIADVTHFLEFRSPLDIEVAKRATTVYMTDNVYHMLPKSLCELCSLLPGQDRLAFSVIWEMTPKAEVVKHRFAKTVINSCCQLAYEDAQRFIEDPKATLPDDLVRIKGEFTLGQIADAVIQMYELSVHLRTKRFENGAISIGLPKLRMILEKDTGLPKSYVLEQQQDSNRLIEEFMLLANMTVGTHLYSVQPETALLRNHTEPLKRVLHHAQQLLEQYGVLISIQSSACLEDSIRRYELKVDLDTENYQSIIDYRMMVIKRLCIKAMARATYKCSSTIKTEEGLRHYALNVPFYTHFTSPIRRYVDCVVHRQLYSSISGIALPKEWTKELCIQIAANSNTKKYNARLAQEESNILYFTYLVGLTGPFVALTMVAEIKERSMILILCQVGIKVQVFYADIEDEATIKFGGDSSINSVLIRWKKPRVTEVFSMFTLAIVRLRKDPQHFRLNAILLPPQ